MRAIRNIILFTFSFGAFITHKISSILWAITTISGAYKDSDPVKV